MRLPEVVAAGSGLVIVAGGDGTIGDVATVLVGSDTVLEIIPIGTMNNLARSLGVPLGIDEACALIGMGTTRRIDAGRVSAGGGLHAVHFFDCAGLGLLAVAAVAGQAFEKRRWHMLPGAPRKFFDAKLGTMHPAPPGAAAAGGRRRLPRRKTLPPPPRGARWLDGSAPTPPPRSGRCIRGWEVYGSR